MSLGVKPDLFKSTQESNPGPKRIQRSPETPMGPINPNWVQKGPIGASGIFTNKFGNFKKVHRKVWIGNGSEKSTEGSENKDRIQRKEGPKIMVWAQTQTWSGPKKAGYGQKKSVLANNLPGPKTKTQLMAKNMLVGGSKSRGEEAGSLAGPVRQARTMEF